uniref:UFSP2 N-terminal MPN-like domain-containing protein n=1 Tax=Phlebotomus papatasi TaxID=29031 RepID=A0A1B0GQK1_PHLPP
MSPKLSFTKNLFQRLKTVKTSFRGCLYGVRTEESLLVLGFVVSNTLDDGSLSRVDEAFTAVENNLPAGVDFCGYIVVGEVLEAGKSFEGNTDVSHCALLTCSTDLEQVAAGFLVKGVFREFAYDTLEFGEVIERLYLVRTQYKTNLMVELTEDCVRAVFRDLRKKFSSGRLHFSARNSDIYVSSEVSRGEVSQGDVPNVEVIFAEINRNPEGSKAKGKKETFSDYRVINIDVLVNRTELRDEFSNKRCVRVKFSNAQKYSIPLILEGMSLVPKETDTNELYHVLVESLSRNLSLVEETLLASLDRDEDSLSLRSYNVIVIHPNYCVS